MQKHIRGGVVNTENKSITHEEAQAADGANANQAEWQSSTVRPH